MLTNSVRIVVDADSCPVKQEIIYIAAEFKVGVLMVSSYDHALPQVEGVAVVQVDRSQQSADLYIANHIANGDIIITQDYGLAALAIAKGCRILSPRGDEYHSGNIDYLLDRRHFHAKIRRSGRHHKGPKSFTDADRKKFIAMLSKVLRDMQENVQF